METYPCSQMRRINIIKMSVVAKAIYLLFSRSVMSNSLWPHGLQHARLPCKVNKTPDKTLTGMFPELVKKKNLKFYEAAEAPGKTD